MRDAGATEAALPGAQPRVLLVLVAPPGSSGAQSCWVRPCRNCQARVGCWRQRETRSWPTFPENLLVQASICHLHKPSHDHKASLVASLKTCSTHGSEKSSNWSKDTQQISGGTGLRTQVCLHALITRCHRQSLGLSFRAPAGWLCPVAHSAGGHHCRDRVQADALGVLHVGLEPQQVETQKGVGRGRWRSEQGKNKPYCVGCSCGCWCELRGLIWAGRSARRTHTMLAQPHGVLKRGPQGHCKGGKGGLTHSLQLALE